MLCVTYGFARHNFHVVLPQKGMVMYMNTIFDANILIVDDEIDLQKMIMTLLHEENFTNIYAVKNGEEALQVLEDQSYNIILLDIMLPDINGFDLFSKIEKISTASVIFLSARDEDIDKLTGLGLGADDYITKPFLPKELVLRMISVLKRTYNLKTQMIKLGETTINLDKATCTKGTQSINLTATEYIIFNKLFENNGNIVTIDSLCSAVWKDGNYGYENTLMVHIRRLREKMEQTPSSPKFLVTVRGLGYRLILEGQV